MKKNNSRDTIQKVEVIGLKRDVNYSVFVDYLRNINTERGDETEFINLRIPSLDATTIEMMEVLESSSVVAENDIYEGVFAVDVSPYLRETNHRFFEMFLHFIKENTQITFILYSRVNSEYDLDRIVACLKDFDITFNLYTSDSLDLKKCTDIKYASAIGY